MQVRSWAGPTIAIIVTGATTLLYVAGPADIPTVVGLLGFFAIALFVRSWLGQLETRLTSTEEERRRLNASEVRAQVSHLANVASRERLRTDIAAAETHIEQRIAEGIATARHEFEATRAIEICQAYEEGAMNERNGVHSAGSSKSLPAADLIYLADRRPRAADGPTACGTGIKAP